MYHLHHSKGNIGTVSTFLKVKVSQKSKQKRQILVLFCSTVLDCWPLSALYLLYPLLLFDKQTNKQIKQNKNTGTLAHTHTWSLWSVPLLDKKEKREKEKKNWAATEKHENVISREQFVSVAGKTTEKGGEE